MKKKVKKISEKHNIHPDHNTELHRLSRIIGQLGGVRKMIEDGRYCIDILQQTSAITSAVQSLERAILKKHFEHCVRGAFMASSEKEVEKKIKELLKVFGRGR